MQQIKYTLKERTVVRHSLSDAALIVFQLAKDQGRNVGTPVEWDRQRVKELTTVELNDLVASHLYSFQ